MHLWLFRFLTTVEIAHTLSLYPLINDSITILHANAKLLSLTMLSFFIENQEGNITSALKVRIVQEASNLIPNSFCWKGFLNQELLEVFLINFLQTEFVKDLFC